MTHDIGFRGTLGARKNGSYDYWCLYQTEQEHQYDNLHVTSMMDQNLQLTKQQ